MVGSHLGTGYTLVNNTDMAPDLGRLRETDDK